jgi:hypothetical protein
MSLSEPQKRELRSLVKTGKPSKPIKGTNGGRTCMDALARRGLVREEPDGRWTITSAGRKAWARLESKGSSCLEADCEELAIDGKPFCMEHEATNNAPEKLPPWTRASYRRSDADEGGPGYDTARAKREG